MNYKNIIRAWKDPEYRMGLSDAERVLLPLHPAGLIELSDAVLDYAVGGRGSVSTTVDTVHPPCVGPTETSCGPLTSCL